MTQKRDDDGDRAWRTLIAVIVIGLGAPLLCGISHPDPPRSEQLPGCGASTGYPCRYFRSDGTLMVRWVTTARGLEESTAAEYDEGYLDGLREGAAPCARGTGIGPSSGC